MRWSWGNGHGAGTVAERSEASVSRIIDAKQVTWQGSRKGPALLIEQGNGQSVLKLRSEVERID